MANSIQFLDEAFKEAIAARDWYLERSPAAANGFINALEVLLRSIEQDPALGIPAPQGCKRRLFRRYPFSVFFVHENGRIVIVAVAHNRRQPGYWRGRLSGI